MDLNLFTTNETVAFAAIAGALGLVAAAARYSWRVAAGAMATEGAPRLHDVIKRLGIDFTRVNDERTLRAAAIGIRRCLTCRHQEACDAWLADNRHRGVPPDCPNEAFLHEQARR
jgi:hypothetical protein